MKTTIVHLIASIAAAAVVSLFVVKVVSAQKPNELFYENVEVLADGEGGETYSCETVIRTAVGKTFYCGTCDWVTNSLPGFFSANSICNK